ncbi:hypothetical protein PILCRDRAFT_822177 [Piloderma croceum F 1598]|uniref:COX assembly mitochondrial protein n=1 Tax=Piloderma croceum (strain F 1598) TaxID=765440 RepID=A0A0C3FM81_PILCF|nr:hypothetical protein PILCRDRAFT_822177 [Piloderma croceum F 1598]
MHPQLQSEKRIVCKDLIQALDACHYSGWRRLTGQCNHAKDQVNKCLHEETLKRAARNRDIAKESRRKVDNDWKDLHQDD